jgi:hypothetical protein
MSAEFLLVGDTHNSFEVLQISGTTAAEIRKFISSPRWKIYEVESAGCPAYPPHLRQHIVKCDWNNKSRYLRNLIFLERMAAQGKTAFPVKVALDDGGFANRMVYAKSFEHLLQKYPNVEMSYRDILSNDLDFSDVDDEDKNLQKLF